MDREYYDLISEFELGDILQTKRIGEEREKNTRFNKEVEDSFQRYCRADFKGMSHSEIELNEIAIENGDGGIFGAYKTSLGKIYIITEHDRSYTTILFADEY